MKHFTLPQNITTYIINNVTCHQFKENKKLEWQRFANEKWFNWKESKTFANQLKLNGAGWKLPELNELKGLVNKNYNHRKHMYYRKSFNFVCFGDYMRYYFWSASPEVGYNGYGDAWVVVFYGGYSDSSNVGHSYYVRCVR